MTPKCVGALLARNEAAEDRYLLRALDNAAQFCDAIVVVDDASLDETAAICAMHPKVTEVIRLTGSGWWGTNGSEAPARQILWELAAKHAGPDGWVLLFDADHELLGITPAELRAVLKATTANCFACVLWDTWDDENLHRVDGPWVGWAMPRPWLFRAVPVPDFKPEWNGRTIHVGHAPPSFPAIAGLLPPGTGIRHLGYWRKEHRKLKLHKYLSLGLTTKS